MGPFVRDFSGVNPLAAAACAYAENGWHVLPVNAETKLPRTRWRKGGPASKSTTDEVTIQRWWRRWPTAGIGIETGPISGVVVLDIDGDEGHVSLKQYEADHGPLPETLQATTPSGGVHFYFQGEDLKTAAGLLGEGLDTRGGGGFVLAPPTVRPDGSAYVWADEGVMPAPLPQVLADAAARRTDAVAADSGDGTRRIHTDTATYVAQVVKEEMDTVRTAANGQRNDRLNIAAHNLGRFVGGGYLDEDEARDRLLDAVLRAGLPASESRATITSGLKAGRAKPLTLVVVDEDDVLAAVEAEFLLNLESASDHMADMLDDDEIAALPPIEFAVEDWVPVGTYTVIYGEPGIGKTFALLGISRAVRRGTKWQGNKTTQGSVLFYQGEGLRQFQDRIAAWDDRYPLRKDQTMAPVGYSERIVDLTKPSGVAAVIRTVRRFEDRHRTKVRVLVIDPLVEFMTGEENGEGMERASRGLRALAKLLDVGVVVGHHTNASGERERGAAFLRMRAGAHIRMEPLDDTYSEIGLMQHKQRNANKLALVLEMRSTGRSVVLEWTEAMLVQEYVAKKEGARRRKRDETKAVKRSEAEALLLAAVEARPGIAKSPLVIRCLGKNVGKTGLENALAGLVANGTLRVEGGDRNAQKHYLAE
jgi:hypothetical protein